MSIDPLIHVWVRQNALAELAVVVNVLHRLMSRGGRRESWTCRCVWRTARAGMRTVGMTSPVRRTGTRDGTGAQVHFSFILHTSQLFFDLPVESILTRLSLSGTNRCPKGSQCSLWSEVFPTAQSMCEKIWSNSYMYTTLSKDSGRCMQMWFTGPNPNKKVAEFYLSGAAETVTLATSLHLFAFLMMLLAWEQPADNTPKTNHGHTDTFTQKFTLSLGFVSSRCQRCCCFCVTLYFTEYCMYCKLATESWVQLPSVWLWDSLTNTSITQHQQWPENIWPKLNTIKMTINYKMYFHFTIIYWHDFLNIIHKNK